MRISTPLALCALLAVACDPEEEDDPCGPGFAMQLLPMAGLSGIEIFPYTPEYMPLYLNSALIDGNRASAAGVDLGFAPSERDDMRLRDVGVEIAFPYPAVDELHVWVDRDLPPAVSSSYSWSAYASDDNLHWTPIALGSPVSFGVLDPRFEIRIQRTQRRYLKVVTAPLALGVTTETDFASVQVTEVQAFEIAPSCGTIAAIADP